MLRLTALLIAKAVVKSTLRKTVGTRVFKSFNTRKPIRGVPYKPSTHTTVQRKAAPVKPKATSSRKAKLRAVSKGKQTKNKQGPKSKFHVKPAVVKSAAVKAAPQPTVYEVVQSLEAQIRLQQVTNDKRFDTLEMLMTKSQAEVVQRFTDLSAAIAVKETIAPVIEEAVQTPSKLARAARSAVSKKSLKDVNDVDLTAIAASLAEPPSAKVKARRARKRVPKLSKMGVKTNDAENAEAGLLLPLAATKKKRVVKEKKEKAPRDPSLATGPVLSMEELAKLIALTPVEEKPSAKDVAKDAASTLQPPVSDVKKELQPPPAAEE